MTGDPGGPDFSAPHGNVSQRNKSIRLSSHVFRPLALLEDRSTIQKCRARTSLGTTATRFPTCRKGQRSAPFVPPDELSLNCCLYTTRCHRAARKSLPSYLPYSHIPTPPRSGARQSTEEYADPKIASLYSVLLGRPAIITPAEREAMFVRFSETRDLVRTAHGLSPHQLQYRPGTSRWSVAENLEHITIVEQNILASLARTLQKPPASAPSNSPPPRPIPRSCAAISCASLLRRTRLLPMVHPRRRPLRAPLQSMRDYKGVRRLSPLAPFLFGWFV